MPLVTLDIPIPPAAPFPARVVALLAEADVRIRDFFSAHQGEPLHGYVPCDFELVYAALRAARDLEGHAGRFCEWGCGFGVVTAMAGMLDFDACGIEIRPHLAAEARRVMEDFDLAAEILEGSFIPDDYEEPEDVRSDDRVTILSGSGALDEVDVEIDDFDLIFAYPWPGEEALYFDLFERRAALGEVLITYHGVREGVLVQRLE